jgi:hypothetical protein
MAQTKYVIFKQEDAHKYLMPEQKQQLMDILRSVAQGRANDKKSVNDMFFVLNMKDVYAAPALEAYIRAIQLDGTYETNLAIKEAMDTAVRVKTNSALTVSTHLPD